MALLSETYRAQLRALHSGKWGDEGHTWATPVASYAATIGAPTILDYGCGKGTLAPALRERFFLVTEYDPAIVGKDTPPSPADLVASTDVLEHIEPESLDEVLAHIASLARVGVFLVISCRRAVARLPDGRNAHLIVESPEWWRDKLARHWPSYRIAGDARELIFMGLAR
jgi:hypothetical protein